MATGSEVAIIMAAAERLSSEGLAVRLVSFPSWELFEAQPESYQESVLPAASRVRVAVEAGVRQGWDRWIGEEGDFVGLDRFGASAPYADLYRNLGLTAERVVDVVHARLGETIGK
jgi:transketolase